MTKPEPLPNITEVNICPHCHGEEYVVPEPAIEGATSVIALCADCGQEVGVVELQAGAPVKRGWLAALRGA